jgi:hypothetical protein
MSLEQRFDLGIHDSVQSFNRPGHIEIYQKRYAPSRELQRDALCTASALFQFLPKFLMDYVAGWGNRTNRDGTAPLVLNIHLLGRKTVPGTCEKIANGRGIDINY